MNRILSLVRRCVEDYDMIQPDDRVAVGVSGGKDSLTLLVALAKLREFYPTLDALCEDLDEDKTALCARLSAVGYAYDPQRNQFV